MKVRVVISYDFTAQERRNLADPNRWGGGIAKGKSILSRNDLEKLIRMFGDPAQSFVWDHL
jgi:hypothetical protein